MAKRVLLRTNDPHETANIADERPEIVREGPSTLQKWVDKRLFEAAHGERGGTPGAENGVTDPMREVLRGKGPYYTWDVLEEYAKRLQRTGRSEHAEELLERHR